MITKAQLEESVASLTQDRNEYSADNQRLRHSLKEAQDKVVDLERLAERVDHTQTAIVALLEVNCTDEVAYVSHTQYMESPDKAPRAERTTLYTTLSYLSSCLSYRSGQGDDVNHRSW